MAAEPVFVDTNILVYVDQARSLFHAPARAAIARLERDGAALWISRQVLREYLATVKRPDPAGVSPMTGIEAADAVEGFLTVYALAEDGPAVTAQVLALLRRVPVGGKHADSDDGGQAFRSKPSSDSDPRRPGIPTIPARVVIGVVNGVRSPAQRQA